MLYGRWIEGMHEPSPRGCGLLQLVLVWRELAHPFVALPLRAEPGAVSFLSS